MGIESPAAFAIGGLKCPEWCGQGVELPGQGRGLYRRDAQLGGQRRCVPRQRRQLRRSVPDVGQRLADRLQVPVVEQLRSLGHDVLELVQEGISFKEITEKYYTELAIEDIKACAWYATQLVKHEEVHIGVG